MTVKNYTLKAANGKHVRVATMVVLDNGKEIKFMEKMSKKEAIRNAQFYMDRELNIWA
jgi:hypothetical protein